MRFNFVQKIVERILADVPCPRCRVPFEAGTIKMKAFIAGRVEFQAECAMCGAHVTIVGRVHNKGIRNEGFFIPSTRNRSRRAGLVSRKNNIVLSPESVRQISKALKSFKGSSVRELLE